mmetsp:Transcript_81123/g.173537  ORF Transcript_81123/g.173537 Transcript_81123/m.173537 type:complete len:205 (-) Transcript_81123:885-1499(-)
MQKHCTSPPRPSRREDCGEHAGTVAFECVQVGPTSGTPEARRAVGRSRQQELAIWGEGDGAHLRSVPRKNLQASPIRYGPEPRCAVRRGSRQTRPTGGEGCRLDLCRVSHQRKAAISVLGHGPQTCCSVGGGGDHQGAIGGEVSGCHLALMSFQRLAQKEPASGTLSPPQLGCLVGAGSEQAGSVRREDRDLRCRPTALECLHT